jgi:two-component system response regulator FixJ
MAHDGVVHLIDDDDAVRQAVAFMLTASGYAVRTYDSAISFLKGLATVQPGCIVTDMRMPGMDGLELQREIKHRQVDLPVIIMTGHGDVPLAVAAMKAGAVDFIEKPFNDRVLLASIGLAIERQARESQRDAEVADLHAKVARLSPRERQVLEGLVAGHANKTIAYDLKLSPRTVEVHRANVMVKMGAASLSDLVRMAFVVRAAGPPG